MDKIESIEEFYKRKESKIMLRHSKWNVSEISDALGFAEVTHFNNFFKKHLDISPLKFRNA